MAVMPDIRIRVVIDAGQPHAAEVLEEMLLRIRGLQETSATPAPAEPFPEDIEVEAALDQLIGSYGPGVSAFTTTAALAHSIISAIRQRREEKPRG
jgi:hypothetical protein